MMPLATLFAAVQEKFCSRAVARRCRIRGAPALLTGRLFDEHGHRMTPTHSNKKGVRYSYYVSQALLCKRSPGSIARVSAPELERVVVGAICRHLQGEGTDPRPIPETDRELIERHLRQVTLSAREVTLHLRKDVAGCEVGQDKTFATVETTVAIPWTGPAAARPKGIAHVPAHNTPMKPGRRSC
jgi:hypothetical protein